MGRGKTSTITPIILLKYYFTLSSPKNINIILPPHLVISSYNIIIKYSYVLNDMIILNSLDMIKENNTITISSDAELKYYLLTNINTYDELRYNIIYPNF